MYLPGIPILTRNPGSHSESQAFTRNRHPCVHNWVFAGTGTEYLPGSKVAPVLATALCIEGSN